MPIRYVSPAFTLILVILALALGVGLSAWFELSPEIFRGPAAQEREAQAAGDPPAGQEDQADPHPAGGDTFREIAANQSPIVVNIRTEGAAEMTEGLPFGEDFFEWFFGQPGPRPEPQPRIGVGSGFVIDEAGLILTNSHVVAGATEIEVGLFGDEGVTYAARVVGQDPLTDSALIELTEKPEDALPQAELGDSDEVAPGDWVMAIGNPFNLAHTVTVGVVSAVDRPYPVAEGRWADVLQTDAAINPGNSGGPLLNSRGQVIGISMAILAAGGSPANAGIGFAVPINVVKDLLPELRRGRVVRGRIGVQVTEVPRQAVERFGLDERQGTLVAAVEPGGPAADAGVQPGDVIVSFNDQPVDDRDELIRLVAGTRPGTTVPLTVMRDRKRQTLELTVEELQLEQAGAEQPAGGTQEAGFGMRLADLTPAMRQRLEVPESRTGAVIADVQPGSAAADAGLAPGDIILEVNREPVAGAEGAAQALQAVEAGDVAFLLIWREGQELFLTATKEG